MSERKGKDETTNKAEKPVEKKKLLRGLLDELDESPETPKDAPDSLVEKPEETPDKKMNDKEKTSGDKKEKPLQEAGKANAKKADAPSEEPKNKEKPLKKAETSKAKPATAAQKAAEEDLVAVKKAADGEKPEKPAKSVSAQAEDAPAQTPAQTEEKSPDMAPPEPEKLPEQAPGEVQSELPPLDDAEDALVAAAAMSEEASPKIKKKVAPPSGDFVAKAWNPWLKPVAVLAGICFVVSLLLGITNNITKPIIAANEAAATTTARMELLPQAEDFEDITPDPLPSGITSVHRATNDAGYVIVAYGKGYGGNVPAMVAFGQDGNIAGVRFLANSETPGLGQNLLKPKFGSQFTGLSAAEDVSKEDIDAIAAATLSTNAALAAVNTARQYYYVELMGGKPYYEMSDEDLAILMPGANSWQQLDITHTGVVAAYRGDDDTYVIVTQAQGSVSPVTTAVALGESGTIYGLYIDVSGETSEMQDLVLGDPSFINSFENQTSVDGVDAVAGATVTSDAIKEAVGYALDALPLAKEA